MESIKEVKTYQSYWKIVGLVCFYNIGSFYFGYSFAYFNSMPYSDIHYMFAIPFQKAVAQGIYSGCIPFGAIFGSLTLQFIISFASRRQILFIFNFLIIISGVFVLIVNPYTLLIGRIFQGVCVGALSGFVPMFIKQISPIQISGEMGGFQNIFICFGYLIGFFLSYSLSLSLEISAYWPIIVSFTLLITVIQQILLFTVFTNQTPKYLILKGKTQQAFNIIKQIYLPEFQSQIYHQKLKDFESDNEFFATQEKQYPQDNWKAVFLAIFLAIFQQLSGINIILLYGPELAKGFLPSIAGTFALLICIEKLLVSIFTLKLLQKFGRKALLLPGIALILFSLLSFYMGLKIKEYHRDLAILLIIGGVFVFIIAFVSTFGPILWLYNPEIIQPNKLQYAVTSNWAMNALIIIFFPIIRKQCGDIDCPSVFLFFSGCMLIGYIVCHFFMVETKGKTELQIRQEFNMKKIC